MKSYRKELFFNIPKRRGLVNITRDVQKAIDESGVREGLVLVNAMNITASVFINDDESGLHQDYETWLEKLAPEKPYSQYRHNGYEDNADAAVLPVVYDVPFVIAHRIEVFPEELLLFRCEFIPKGIGAFCEFHILF